MIKNHSNTCKLFANAYKNLKTPRHGPTLRSLHSQSPQVVVQDG